MKDGLPCKFSLIRYVPEPVKGEFVNIGVLLILLADPQSVAVRFTEDWSKVQRLDPSADIEMLRALVADLEGRLVRVGHDRIELIWQIFDSFSLIIQITDFKLCVAESMSKEIERLMQVYVDPQTTMLASDS